jgi:hypothetical protein
MAERRFPFAQDIVTDCDKYAASDTDPNAHLAFKTMSKRPERR